MSFATLNDGAHVVTVTVAPHEPELSPNAIRIIQVPFEAPPRGSVSIASIPNEVSLELRPGRYALRFSCFPLRAGADPAIELTFTPEDDGHFALLRADAELSPGEELLLTASPA